MTPKPAGTLLFIGNATTLVRCAGFTVLTDPNFLHRGERASLGYGLWSRRLTEPALQPADLPPLDAVVLSHLHGDHFDRRARRGLDKDVPVVTTKHAKRWLRRWGFRHALALDTWQSWSTRRDDGSRLRVSSLPGKHAFGPLGAMLPPVMGSLIEIADADGRTYRIYVTGDTLVHDALREITRRHPDIDLGVLHLGGTRVLGQTVTMDGAQGVELLELVPVPHAVPIHYDDYGVFTSPVGDFTAAAQRRGTAAQIHVVPRGGEIALPGTAQPAPTNT
jgi:L-ascorbate metabolism protein UlaG (beta-lactamase superfamily)